MKDFHWHRFWQAGTFTACLLGCCLAFASETILRKFALVSTPQIFREFGLVSKDWQHYAGDFIAFVKGVGRLYLPVLFGVPLVFLLHYIVIGPKKFAPSGKKIWFYSGVTRFFHWASAIFFSLLVLTGLMIIFAKFIGGGPLVLSARTIHLWSAYGFLVVAAPLFIIWIKDMLPAPYDLLWLLKAGGYLSRKNQEIPAGKFNFGQKMWFWLAFLGGAVMFYTGYCVSIMAGQQAEMAGFIKIHLILGLCILAFFITHLYMSLFAIKGSLRSMISGYKWEEEVRILHGRMLK